MYELCAEILICTKVFLLKLHFYLEKDIGGFRSSHRSNFLYFMQFLEKFWQNNRLVPPSILGIGVARHLGNPGSATETFSKIRSPHRTNIFEWSLLIRFEWNKNHLFSIWRSERSEYLTYAHLWKAISSLVILAATDRIKRDILWPFMCDNYT